MRKEIHRLEDRLWKRREELYESERESEERAPVGASPQRSETPTGAIKPTTINQAAMVSQL